MPLTPEKKKKYAKNWKYISVRLKEERAKNHCEKCGRAEEIPMERKAKRVILSVAHLDHDESNNDYNNLLVVCGSCHLAIDRRDNIVRRKRNKLLKNNYDSGNKRPEIL